MVKGDRGAVLIPCLLFAGVILTAGIGIWGLMRHWHHLARAQLQQDRCVGEKALELKSLLMTLDQSNERMRWERRSAVLGLILPETLPSIRAILIAEETVQEGLRARWELEGLAWRAGKACRGNAGAALRFPSLSWKRPPPDELGPHPFDWGEPGPRFVFLARRSRHFSAAEVWRATDGKKSWSARWIAASAGAFGANLH